jgi:hypothetical protein
MSVILKTPEKLLDRHIRGGVLVERPLHQNQSAYRAGMSMETALFQVVHRLEKCLEHKEIALGAFLDIEGAFDNSSLMQYSWPPGSVDLRKPDAGGSGPCLKASSYTLPLWVTV